MKTFLIHRPKGKSTCSLLEPYYDPVDRRTKKRYLGSVNICADPDAVPACINRGNRAHGALTVEQIEEVRRYLRVHGTFGQLPQLPVEVLARLRNAVRDELEREMRAREAPPLYAACAALEGAARDVERLARYYKDRGDRLSPGMLNSLSTESKANATPLDLLKVEANLVRAAFQQFEAALKAAGLMKSVTRAPKRAKQPAAIRDQGRSSPAAVK